MVERQDIDALLISALYGELTPAEETRLAVHLESHPGDRSALADLTHARGLVRESRLLQFQLDPPASVSALLLKEATRCAPKPAAQEGWFARFVRSFAAHPAMAAAAMLVLILGVATLATRKDAQFAESTAPASEPALDNYAAPTGGAMGSSSVAPAITGSSDPGAFEAKPDTFRVALEEGAAKDLPADGLADKKTAEKQKRAEAVVTKSTSDRGYDLKLAKEQGIELRKPQAAPKDFDDAPRPKGGKAASEAKNELAFGDSETTSADRAPRGGEVSTGTLGGAVAGGSAPGGTRRAQDPAAAPAQPTATASRPTAPRATSTPAPPPAAEPRRDAPAKTVDRNATARAAGPAEDKAADPQLAWARDQHNALIAQVRAGECKKAASIATAISNRAPAYYQQNVETDRSIKACIAYINSERERDAEQRSERARANQKRSVNEPAPTTTDSTK